MITKQYYKCVKFFQNPIVIDYWRTSKPKLLLESYDIVIPLGYHRPRNIKLEEIKT